MKKVAIISAILIISIAVLAAGPAPLGDVEQPVMPQRPIGGAPGPVPQQPPALQLSLFNLEPGFMGWILRSLPDININSQVKSVEVINGEIFITVEASGETYRVYMPSVVVRMLRVTIKRGDQIEVNGKELTLKQGILIIPEDMRINGEDYNLRALMQKYQRFFMERRPNPGENPLPPVEKPVKPPRRP